MELPPDMPGTWLNPEQSSVVIRFADSRFDQDRSRAEILRRFPGAREITTRNMPLRSIFVALAKSAQQHS